MWDAQVVDTCIVRVALFHEPQLESVLGHVDSPTIVVLDVSYREKTTPVVLIIVYIIIVVKELNMGYKISC